MKESKLYKISRPFVSLFVKIFLRPKIIGRENILKTDKLIIAGTHTGFFDALLLMSATKRPLHFLAKKELFKGMFGFIFKHMGLIAVDRSKKDRSVLENARKYLDDGKVVTIFPEGTYSRKRKLLPFKIGTVKLAFDTKTKIVPFVIKGRYFRSGLKLIFGSPFEIENSDLTYENDKFHKLIEEMLERD